MLVNNQKSGNLGYFAVKTERFKVLFHTTNPNNQHLHNNITDWWVLCCCCALVSVLLILLLFDGLLFLFTILFSTWYMLLFGRLFFIKNTVGLWHQLHYSFFLLDFPMRNFCCLQLKSYENFEKPTLIWKLAH